MSIYRITVKALHTAGGAQYNIHHYEFPGFVPTTGEAEEACQALADVYEEVLMGQFADQVTFEEIEYRRVDVADLPTAVYVPTGWPRAGGGTGVSLPSQVAAVLRWVGNTTFPRSARTYLPSFVAGTLATNGQLTGAVQAVMNTAALAMEQLEITGQPDAQKVAVQYGGAPTAVIASNLVSQRPVEGTWGIQRRRRRGTGI